MQLRHMIILTLSLAFFSESSLFAQTPKDAQYVNGYVRGHEFQVTYREGEALYGTYYSIDVHFCSSGRYISYVQTRKQTVLGNEQADSWNDSGNWDVVSFQGYPSLRYISASGKQDIIPMQILRDGTIRPLSGAFMKQLGKAQCK